MKNYDYKYKPKIDNEMRVIRSSLQLLIEYGPSKIKSKLRKSVKNIDIFFQMELERLFLSKKLNL